MHLDEPRLNPLAIPVNAIATRSMSTSGALGQGGFRAFGIHPATSPECDQSGALHGLSEHPPARRTEAGGHGAANLPGRSSLEAEWELPEDGLAAFGEDGDALMLAVTRQIANVEREDAKSVEMFVPRRGTPRPSRGNCRWTTGPRQLDSTCSITTATTVQPLVNGRRVWNRWRKVGILAIIPVAMRPGSGTNAPG